MKKILLLLAIAFFAIEAKAQFHIGGSAKTVTPGRFMFGLSPYMMLPLTESNLYKKTIGANFVSGYGITDGIDTRFKLGVYSGTPLDTEDGEQEAETKYYAEFTAKFQLYSYGGRQGVGFAAALEAGAHSWQALAGYDAKVNLTFRANRYIYLYTGFDFDYNNELKKNEDNLYTRSHGIYYWIPAGLEFRPNEYTSLILEGAVPMSDQTAYYAGVALHFIPAGKKRR